MKKCIYEVIVRMGSDALSLQGSAMQIFATIGISGTRFIENHGANSSYDFYWRARRGGVEYQVRGDRWEMDEHQESCTVSLIGGGANVKATELYSAVRNFGWAAELVREGKKI